MASGTAPETASDTASDTASSTGVVNGTGGDWINNTPAIPMTTPFAMPSDCLDYNGGTVTTLTGQLYYSSGSIGNSSAGNGTWGPATQLRQNDNLLRRSSCLPSGASDVVYFPAVCPSAWTYYSMVPADTYTWITTNSTPTYPRVMTTAYCCPSGYSMFVPNVTVDQPVQSCSRQFASGEISVTVFVGNETTAMTAFHGAGTLLYQPMAVSWVSEAVETMSPEPPYIDQYSFVPTWVPDTEPRLFAKKVAEPLSSHSTGLATTVFVAVIAVPILMFIVILGCCICCFRSRRRKEKREIEKERVESEAAAAAAAVTTAAAPITTTIDTSVTQYNRQSRADGEAAASAARDADTSASAQGHSPVDPFDDSMAIQRPSTEHHTAIHPLAGFVKPPYPGLPSHGFDGIDEPPPYMESASYDATRGGPHVTPGQTQEQTSQQTPHNTEREAHG